MKKKTSPIQQETTAIDSVLYGVKNAEKIPVRVIGEDSIKQQEKTIEQLFLPTAKFQQVEVWQSVLLITTLLLLGLAKAFSVNRFKQTIKSLFNYRVAQEICSEEKVFFHRVNAILTTNYFLITALFIYQLKTILNPEVVGTHNSFLYVFIILFLLLLFFVKLISSKILGFIFRTPQLINDYMFNVALFNNLLGVFLIPVLVLMYFTSLDFELILTYIALPLVLISFILRLLRIVVLGREKGIFYIYIFLYICTLEILPLVVMIKIFIFK